jgi:serine/threonine-protein kinase
MMGTPTYVSPEQARGKNVDYRTDIYALGCITYEMVCGRLPFIAQTAMDIVLKHLTEAPAPPISVRPHVPPALDELILQMLEKDPNRRPPIAHVRAVFADLVASGTVAIEHSSGITIRSDLKTRRGAETPSKVRYRTPSPSEAPTGLQGTAVGRAPAAGSAAAMPAAPPAKKRRRLAVAIGGVALGAVAGVVAFLAVSADDSGADTAKPGSAAVVAAAPPPADAAPPADAPPLAEPSADAAAPTTEIHVDTAARIEVDGVVLQTAASSATLPLAPGMHHVVVTAAGKRPFDKTLALAATPLEVHLDPLHRASGARAKPPAQGSGSEQPPHKDDNYTVDPFSQ